MKCWHCRAPASAVCGRCLLSYCGESCQQEDWRSHKRICAALQLIGGKRKLEGEGGSGKKRSREISELEEFVLTQSDVTERLFLTFLHPRDVLTACEASRLIFDFCVRKKILDKLFPNPIAGLIVSDEVLANRLIWWFAKKMDKNILPTYDFDFQIL